MTYEVSLFSVGLAVGVLLVLGHLLPFFQPELTKKWLLEFPRSLSLGKVLLVIAVAWSIWLILTIDLGEFAALRQPMAIATFVCGVLTWIFVEEFLSVRALSIIFLLAADVLLCAAFLEPPMSRLWLVFLAYAWIVGGLFCVGLPWLMRDALAWVTKSDWRLRGVAGAGVAYGLILIISAVAFWR